MKSKMLKAALYYYSMGFSVIPIRLNKKPYIDWKRYQIERPLETEIKGWWKRWPEANIGIACGKVSGIDILDIDSEEGLTNVLDNYLSESELSNIPVTETPKGHHLYFKHKNGLRNGVRVIHDCDIRTTGGYVIAPPSKNEGSVEYKWMEGLKITDIPLIYMPVKLFDVLYDGSQKANEPSKENTGSFEPVIKGKRNSTLASLVGTWINQGFDLNNIILLATGWNAKLFDPLELKEVETTVQSIIRTHKRNHCINESKCNERSMDISSDKQKQNDLIIRLRYWELLYSGQLIQRIHDVLFNTSSKGIEITSEVFEKFNNLKIDLDILISGTDEEKSCLFAKVTGSRS